MVKNYYGVLTKTSKGYILYSHESEINLSDELKYFWQLDIPVHILITSNLRQYPLLNESNCPIYYDRDNDRKYKFHINDINIEDMLEMSIGKQLGMTIRWKGRDRKNETENVHKS